MTLKQRINLLEQLREYLSGDDKGLSIVKEKAFEKNNWFISGFVDLALQNITSYFLDPAKLSQWAAHYHLDNNIQPKTIGVVMAGNIPLAGFHDFLCVFVSGHRQLIKLSEKDSVLFPHILDKLKEWAPEISKWVTPADLLKNCDAYIATGSNNSSRYFKYYFGKYPSILRGNKTSVAMLTGNETQEQLSLLADDIQMYFGLGCRNVTKLYVPENYDFVQLLHALKKYQYFTDYNKYKNNFDYNLALLIMNNKPYMTNNSIILLEDENIFTPVSQVHYTFYSDKNVLREELKQNENIQCIVSETGVPFGKTQEPGLSDYADGADVMQFLLSL
ncbi:MAG TPA: hypothetical protein VG847_08990 [Chitinophagaceae bacterium]|nr:hypothetical protein [Chitinophagaceae bacterium]